jgi:hydrogenase maturation protease
MRSPATLFVGMGSQHGDDRAGWMVAEALAPRAKLLAVVRQAAAPADIFDWLDGVEFLAICDACQGIGPVGTWRRWESLPSDFPSVRAQCSHEIGLPEVLQLAERLGTLPGKVLVWGLEIGETDPAQPASRDVAAAVPAIVEDVLRVLTAHVLVERPSQAEPVVQNHA